MGLMLTKSCLNNYIPMYREEKTRQLCLEMIHILNLYLFQPPDSPTLHHCKL